MESALLLVQESPQGPKVRRASKLHTLPRSGNNYARKYISRPEGLCFLSSWTGQETARRAGSQAWTTIMRPKHAGSARDRRSRRRVASRSPADGRKDRRSAAIILDSPKGWTDCYLFKIQGPKVRRSLYKSQTGRRLRQRRRRSPQDRRSGGDRR